MKKKMEDLLIFSKDLPVWLNVFLYLFKYLPVRLKQRNYEL
jgi:hypothetical protein